MEIRNHVPAVIRQQDLHKAVRAAGIPAETLLSNTYPELEFPPGYRLECLHGRYRLRAGADILPPGEKRWTVDLYLAGTIIVQFRTQNHALTFPLDINHKLKTSLIEEYSNEKEPDDGEIYCKIPKY